MSSIPYPTNWPARKTGANQCTTVLGECPCGQNHDLSEKWIQYCQDVDKAKFNGNISLNLYQDKCMETALYPNIGNNITYPVLGLGSESGEILGKLKKVIRDNNGVLTEDIKEKLKDELGDVLWYVAAIAHELKSTLEDIAFNNLTKLASRKSRGVIQGDGDNR